MSTEYKTLQAQMIAKASKLTAEELKAEAVNMAQSEEDYATDVLMALLGALESKIPEAEYVEFVNGL